MGSARDAETREEGWWDPTWSLRPLLLSAFLGLCGSLAFETKLHLVLMFGWFQEAQWLWSLWGSRQSSADRFCFGCRLPETEVSASVLQGLLRSAT